ncbi:MAG: hypothetical protein IKM53_03735 [Clostridia bacterium]|nr:hypothetical protein [Clostridia bacterium]
MRSREEFKLLVETKASNALSDKRTARKKLFRVYLPLAACFCLCLTVAAAFAARHFMDRDQVEESVENKWETGGEYLPESSQTDAVYSAESTTATGVVSKDEAEELNPAQSDAETTDEGFLEETFECSEEAPEADFSEVWESSCEACVSSDSTTDVSEDFTQDTQVGGSDEAPTYPFEQSQAEPSVEEDVAVTTLAKGLLKHLSKNNSTALDAKRTAKAVEKLKELSLTPCEQPVAPESEPEFMLICYYQNGEGEETHKDFVMFYSQEAYLNLYGLWYEADEAQLKQITQLFETTMGY